MRAWADVDVCDFYSAHMYAYVCICMRKDGWMDKWTGGCGMGSMDRCGTGWMDVGWLGWMDRWMLVWMLRWMYAASTLYKYIHVCMYVHMDGCMDGGMDMIWYGMDLSLIHI